MDPVRITDALRDLFFEPDPDVDPEDVIDRYYSPDYTYRTGGKLLNRGEFEAMVTAGRALIVRGSAWSVDEVRDGNTYAERHRYHAEFTDGTVLDREVAVFGTIGPDGRFEHLSDAGFDLEPGPAARARLVGAHTSGD
jgi:hypothetical protein